MKPFLTFVLSILALNVFAQAPAKPVNIILTGQVHSFESGEKRYIYFALKGKKFNGKDRIKMDDKTGYVFDLSKTSYKNITSGILVFALDSTYKIESEYACTHRINIGEINKYATAKKLKSIKLANDLIMDYHCEAGVLDEGPQGAAADIAGRYQQTDKDTVRTMELSKS